MPSCPDGQTRCGDGCFNLLTSAEHCGACEGDGGGPCAEGEQCSGGVCAPECAAGGTLCDDGTGSLTCQDLTASHDHCGACGTVCAADQICFGGACVVGSCSAIGRQICAGACVDVDGNAMHCGRCNNPCAEGLFCDHSICASDCSGTADVCEGHCADTQTDLENCGNCATSCPIDQECSLGECR